MKANKKKKAFTLTELLVVVIIIGVLSAVVLPKFNKIVETRKTTEAEELMAAVRTEQEKRCALDKDYLLDSSKLRDILPSTESKNFSYSLTSTGIKAASKGKYAYELQMPSYADGRICCDEETETECLKLNKDYPLCSELIARADYDEGKACAGEELQEPTCTKQPYEEDCPAGQTGKISYTVNSDCEYEVSNTCTAEEPAGCTVGEWVTVTNAPYSVWLYHQERSCSADSTVSCTQYEFQSSSMSESVSSTTETSDTCNGTGEKFSCNSITGNYHTCIDKRTTGSWVTGKTVYYSCSTNSGWSNTIDWSRTGISGASASCNKTGLRQSDAEAKCESSGKTGYICHQMPSLPSVDCGMGASMMNGKWYKTSTAVSFIECKQEMVKLTCEKRATYRYRNIVCE